MIKFNDNNIYVGYIKQLLKGFNLPTVRCYTDDSFLCDGALYIKNNYIQKYIEEKKSFNPIIPFTYNKHLLNYTKNLNTNSLLYDSHTHEYLGEYLRFLRDYKKINLMSMYNCFSNSLISSLYINTQDYNGETLSFETDNKNFKVYAFPVKFFKNYTIAISSSKPIEIICGFYTKSFLYSKDLTDVSIERETYFKINKTDFKTPFIYDKLNNELFKDKALIEHEKDLKMFIKIPLYENSSIVVLEGTYIDTNSKTVNSKTQKWENSSTIVNYHKPLIIKDQITVKEGEEEITYPIPYVAYNQNLQKNVTAYQYYVKDQGNDELNDVQYLSALQLLQLNSDTSFPFADRLIEYLLDNSVTNIETISDNIERVQQELIRRKQEGFTDKFPIYDSDNHVVGYTTGYTKLGISNVKYDGIWENKYKAVLYDIANETGITDTQFDILGYLDKNVETKLGNDIDIYEKE